MNRPNLGRFFITLAVFSFCVGIGMPQIAVAQDKHLFTWEDSSVLHRATTLSVSPDGKAILYLVSYGGDKGPKIYSPRSPSVIVGGPSDQTPG